MPASPEEHAFVTYLVDLMQSVGPVAAKRMFGGHGIFLEGLMFGLVTARVLYLKVDGQTQAAFTERGLEPFTYNRQGKPCRLGYYQAPEEALEDAEAMNAWANLAYGAALRAAAKKGRQY